MPAERPDPAAPGSHTLSLSIPLDLAAPAAWRAWTEPAELSTWFWPPAWNTVYEVDLRPGGRFRYVTAALADPLDVGGEFLDVQPGRSMRHTWQWAGEPARSEVTVAFEPDGGRTRLRLTQSGLPTLQEVESNDQGWRSCIGRLRGLPARP